MAYLFFHRSALTNLWYSNHRSSTVLDLPDLVLSLLDFPPWSPSSEWKVASVLGSRIVAWATSLISRRSSPPHSMTPTPTLGGLTSPKIVVDDAKRTNDSLSQEVTRLRQQVENLTLKAQLQEVELEAVKEVIKSLTAGNRSSGQSRQGQSETTTRNGGRTKEGDSHNDNEWVVQDKPGVYITRTSLPGGVKDLTRVRFSRRRFSEKQAEQWWAENRARVYEQYNARLTSQVWGLGVRTADID
ncbi:Protein Brevis radix-like 4 [Camellia lanceoleosa]|uniref:Protein Brevis radix-like 4 n=1 Tax=Camellia lanceoleosa TaxID=1840588 RepID=A0ACC0F6X9_9ERIC|nr:Protein Brevis radix-like 4 [Camellia lanceoleosa]